MLTTVIVVAMFAVSTAGCGSGPECGANRVAEDGRCVLENPRGGWGATCEANSDCGCYDTEAGQSDRRCTVDGSTPLECAELADGDAICSLRCADSRKCIDTFAEPTRCVTGSAERGRCERHEEACQTDDDCDGDTICNRETASCEPTCDGRRDCQMYNKCGEDQLCSSSCGEGWEAVQFPSGQPRCAKKCDSDDDCPDWSPNCDGDYCVEESQ